METIIHNFRRNYDIIPGRVIVWWIQFVFLLNTWTFTSWVFDGYILPWPKYPSCSIQALLKTTHIQGETTLVEVGHHCPVGPRVGTSRLEKVLGDHSVVDGSVRLNIYRLLGKALIVSWRAAIPPQDPLIWHCNKKQEKIVQVWKSWLNNMRKGFSSVKWRPKRQQPTGNQMLNTGESNQA